MNSGKKTYYDITLKNGNFVERVEYWDKLKIFTEATLRKNRKTVVYYLSNEVADFNRRK